MPRPARVPRGFRRVRLREREEARLTRHSTPSLRVLTLLGSRRTTSKMAPPAVPSSATILVVPEARRSSTTARPRQPQRACAAAQPPPPLAPLAAAVAAAAAAAALTAGRPAPQVSERPRPARWGRGRCWRGPSSPCLLPPRLVPAARWGPGLALPASGPLGALRSPSSRVRVSPASLRRSGSPGCVAPRRCHR